MSDYGIDRHSEYSLYDVLENDFDPWEDDFHFDYYGFHITPMGQGKYGVIYDGHAGTVMRFENDDYDDVLELVADLNRLLLDHVNIEYMNKEADYPSDDLVEWAGKAITNDPERAEKHPDKFLHIPEDQVPNEA